MLFFKVELVSLKGWLVEWYWLYVFIFLFWKVKFICDVISNTRVCLFFYVYIEFGFFYVNVLGLDVVYRVLVVMVVVFGV